jgi:hypothetical protein
MHEESSNGGAKWRLASGEQWGVSPRCWGEKLRKKEAAVSVALFIGEEEREGAVPVLMARWSDRKAAHCLLPCLGRTHVWHGRFEADLATVPLGRAQFINLNTFLFSN